MSEWQRNKKTGTRTRDLGHGLVLQVAPAWPRYTIAVFDRELVTPAKTPGEGKRRAERAARRWLHEALLKL